ncbi:sulfite oxidase [Gordoniibacillus kamchatkensis]|uniref:sulfite oxidase n=1 Tax=Gordoniibacillus kamchatkensis TaxID=1590651 RepID=UPI0009E40E8E|nr:sulfite oxidase [Paenibacillus sp. VKM B-2647]
MNLYDPKRITRSIIPENQEYPILSLTEHVTPESLYYVRNHFPYTAAPSPAWGLKIEGLVQQPRRLQYQDLMRMSQSTLPVTMECSGNKREYFYPTARGEQWEQGAVSHAVWTGVPLRELLIAAGLSDQATHVVFEGMDTGERTDLPGTFVYARSLPIDNALHPDTIVALLMNGKPIPYKHGYPARLIVPGWYGMASVKWLHRITVTNRPFLGPYQTVDYVIYPADPQEIPRQVTVMKVNSVISQPTDQAVKGRGVHYIWGTAWSGHGPVIQMNVSADDGHTWTPAEWLDPEESYSWRRWRWEWSVRNPACIPLWRGPSMPAAICNRR